MRWPWSSRDDTSNAEGAAAGRPVAHDGMPVERPVSAWSSLPAVQRLSRPMSLTSAPTAFPPSLASWRSPSLTRTIARQVDPAIVLRSVPTDGGSGPTGGARTSGLVAMPVRVPPQPAPNPAPVQRYSTEYAVASPAVVQPSRVDAATEAPSRPVLLAARPVGMPVRQLAAEALPPEPTPEPISPEPDGDPLGETAPEGLPSELGGFASEATTENQAVEQVAQQPTQPPADQPAGAAAPASLTLPQQPPVQRQAAEQTLPSQQRSGCGSFGQRAEARRG